MKQTQPRAISSASKATLSMSLIIPTKDRPKELLETVQSIACQARRPEELIIVDQTRRSCERDIRGLLNGCPEMTLKYIWAPEITDLVVARNRGVSESTGDILFFVDDDNTLESDCVKNLIDRYADHPEIAGICAVDTGGLHVPWWLVLARRAYMLGAFSDNRSLVNKIYPRLAEPQATRLFSGGYMSFRRHVFGEFQFESRLWGHRWCSSIDFSYRVSSKYLLVIDPAVRVWHRNPYGTYDPGQWVRVRVAGAFFFFHRNVRKTLVNWTCFLWLLFAIFIRSVTWGYTRGALPVTVHAFWGEFKRGFLFLRSPFSSPY